MLCPKCGHQMVLLLFSAVCDRCDRPTSVSTDCRGYVALKRGSAFPVREEYVFVTKADAARWAELAAGPYAGAPVVAVESVKPFLWQPSRGGIQGLILADRHYEVWPAKTAWSAQCDMVRLVEE